MGEVNIEDWKEMNNLLVGNGNHSKGMTTERAGRLMTEMK